jgi:hypothetical protein
MFCRGELLTRRVSKRELRVSRPLDLDNERHSAFGAAKRERLAGVLVGDGIHVLEVAIRTALDHAARRSEPTTHEFCGQFGIYVRPRLGILLLALLGLPPHAQSRAAVDPGAGEGRPAGLSARGAALDPCWLCPSPSCPCTTTWTSVSDESPDVFTSLLMARVASLLLRLPIRHRHSVAAALKGSPG